MVMAMLMVMAMVMVVIVMNRVATLVWSLSEV